MKIFKIWTIKNMDSDSWFRVLCQITSQKKLNDQSWSAEVPDLPHYIPNMKNWIKKREFLARKHFPGLLPDLAASESAARYWRYLRSRLTFWLHILHKMQVWSTGGIFTVWFVTKQKKENLSQ